MRENAVAAKEAQALAEEAAHASSAGQGRQSGSVAELAAHGNAAGYAQFWGLFKCMCLGEPIRRVSLTLQGMWHLVFGCCPYVQEFAAS